MAASTENANSETISSKFDGLWKKYNELSSSDEPTGSNKIQDTVKESIEICERLIQLVNDLELFSDNEGIDEVTTNEIRFLLLPALLAYFTNKIVKEDRYETVKKCQSFYIDFLKLCKNYGVTDISIPSASEEKDTEHVETRQVPQSQKSLENQRQAKIKRYKEQKEMDAKIKELYPLVQKEHVDEDVKRDYFTTLLKQWINTSQEELDSIESELPILEHMAKMKKSGQSQPEQPSQKGSQHSQKPIRPFIITKNDLQKKVFGLGYPSIPTYTLDEFYDAQVAKGQLPDQGHSASLQGTANDPDAERKQQEASEKEKEDKIEQDDEETLKKSREWDEWRDDHRRGWGNTDNKG